VGWHDSAADSPNPLVDDRPVRLYVITTGQMEGLTHRVNVLSGNERANVRLKTRRFRYCASQLLDYSYVWTHPGAA
jgi:hypothetical protein